MAGASGKKLDETYKLAWLRGLKTTYYLRTMSASSAEKSTGRGGELNAVGVDGSANRANERGSVHAHGRVAGTRDPRDGLHDEAGRCGIRRVRGLPVSRTTGRRDRTRRPPVMRRRTVAAQHKE